MKNKYNILFIGVVSFGIFTSQVFAKDFFLDQELTINEQELLYSQAPSDQYPTYSAYHPVERSYQTRMVLFHCV